ncbi:ABC transporter ATP-binding protein [Lachnospiraceae bacterium C1.1]|nr:ABC transporter ATP-binding protein [Lachnospiraceae bacterium C1.1]
MSIENIDRKSVCLKLIDLTVGYDPKKPVLKNLNLELKKGSILSIMGPNGVGKSTLLMTISKQLDAISGEIFIEGKKIGDYSGKELSRKLAVLFTGREVDRSETVFETVAKGRYPYTGWFGNLTADDESKVFEALEATDCMKLKDKPFEHLSDGQKQRTLIARAIAQETEILILDEPTGYLDLKYQIEIMDLLKRLVSEKQMSIIISIHEIYLAGEYSDKLLMLKDNGLFACDSPEKLMKSETIGELFDIDSSVCDRLNLF